MLEAVDQGLRFGKAAHPHSHFHRKTTGCTNSGERDLAIARLLIALVMNFIFGAVVTLGLGNYAPSLVLFSLLGMDPRAAFPVMMGSGAFTGIVAGIRFLNKGRYDRRAALGLMIGGIPAVLLAAFAVKSLSLGAIRWLVMVVIVYTAVTMFRSASAER